jgi:hypothetical protein
VKYADCAMGQFIDRARTRKYWQDTIFMVVADDTRVYGDELVPLGKFHIPGVILERARGTAADRVRREADRYCADAPVLARCRCRASVPGTGSDAKLYRNSALPRSCVCAR